MEEKYDLHWYGMLTVENVQKIADLLLQLLDGKRYTFVAANESCRFEPEVRTGQRLKAISVYYNEKENPPKYAGFIVVDSYGSWSCSTNLAENKYDQEFRNPYFVFKYNQVTITHRAPAGHLLYWVAAIEQD